MTQETNVQLEHPEAFSEIITNSGTMRSIFQYMEAISISPQPVLITGESGVGKELFAKAIHVLSNRKGNFVTVSVAGLDDNIFADTLFGHKKGVFTGAYQARSGHIEQATGGTLFLYEIGDLSHSSQVKLLPPLTRWRILPAWIGHRKTFRCSCCCSYVSRSPKASGIRGIP